MRTLTAVSACLMMLSVGGCATDVVNTAQIYDPVDAAQMYAQRVDKVTLSAGDAQAVNTRIHEIDPWPRYVRDKRIAVNGQRMVRAVERYQRQGPRPLPVERTGEVSTAAPGGGGP
jgi:hypothetical protein